MPLKLAVIGGGSSYTPELIEGILKHRDQFPVEELVLLDVPEGKEKVEIVTALAKRMAEAKGAPVSIRCTLNPDEALTGADYVVSQFRAGGLQGRWKDEHLPLKYHMLGQETTGPGGFANALRTVPQALALAERMQRLCPNAWLVNFTNPSGIITEALLKHGFSHTIGLCNVAIGVEKGIARALHVDESRVHVEGVGLNHLTWMRAFVDDENVTPHVLGLEEARSEDLHVAIPANLPKPEWPPALLNALGMIPNGYLHYYYETEKSVEEEAAAVARGEGTRADQVMEIERELFKLYRDPNLREKPALLEKRGGAFYSEAAVRLMVGLNTGKAPIQVLNVQNHGTLAGIPDDSVVEIACRVTKTGATPVECPPIPPQVRGLVQAVKAYEELTVEAARKGDRRMAYQALIAHPLVRSTGAAEDLLGDILRENAAYLPAFSAR